MELLHEQPPLWELYLIEDPDERQQSVREGPHRADRGTRPDGTAVAGARRPVFDLDRPAGRSWRPDMVPTDSDLLIKAAWSTVRSPVRTTRRVLNATRRVPVLGEVARLVIAAASSDRAPRRAGRHNDRPVPRVSFNRTVGSHRRVTRVTLSVDQLREIHRQRGVRFHDVLLTVISGALRHWLVVNDELPAEPLVALTRCLVDADSDELGAALRTARHPPPRSAPTPRRHQRLDVRADPRAGSTAGAGDHQPNRRTVGPGRRARPHDCC